MPDLVTHTAAAYFVARNKKMTRYRALFYLGVILPDVLARPMYILWPELFFYTIAIHTPVFMIVFVLLLSEFFPSSERRNVVGFVLAGVTLHFLMDLFQRHLLTGYYWFFPFSWIDFEVPLFWPETPLQLIPAWIAFAAASEMFMYFRRKRSV